MQNVSPSALASNSIKDHPRAIPGSRSFIARQEPLDNMLEEGIVEWPTDRRYGANASGVIFSRCRKWRQFGRVWKPLEKYLDSCGYHVVRVRKVPKYKKPLFYKVHRIVLECFVGPPPFGQPFGAHNDGDKLNNVLSNLRWASPKENSDDRTKHGTVPFGSKHAMAKLTESDIPKIREAIALGATHQAVADTFRVSRSNIGCIVNGRNWTCVPV